MPLQAKLLQTLADTEAQKLTLPQHVGPKMGFKKFICAHNKTESQLAIPRWQLIVGASDQFDLDKQRAHKKKKKKGKQKKDK